MTIHLNSSTPKYSSHSLTNLPEHTYIQNPLLQSQILPPLLRKPPHTDYRTTLAKIACLTQYCEITFNLFDAILVARCTLMSLPHLFKLTSFTRTCIDGNVNEQNQVVTVDQDS
jgi:hypothetical protein